MNFQGILSAGIPFFSYLLRPLAASLALRRVVCTQNSLIASDFTRLILYPSSPWNLHKCKRQGFPQNNKRCGQQVPGSSAASASLPHEPAVDGPLGRVLALPLPAGSPPRPNRQPSRASQPPASDVTVDTAAPACIAHPGNCIPPGNIVNNRQEEPTIHTVSATTAASWQPNPMGH